MIYQLVKSLDDEFFICKRDAEFVSVIPQVKENTDYQAYLAWLAEGNEPEVIV